MMEIKFRYIYKHCTTGGIRTIDFTLDLIELGGPIWNQVHAWVKDGYLFEARVQYTGLNDGNGKEIYEGDILRVPNQVDYVDDAPQFFESEVVYYGGMYELNVDSMPEWNDDDQSTWIGIMPVGSYAPDEIEVIGNIYEGESHAAGA